MSLMKYGVQIKRAAVLAAATLSALTAVGATTSASAAGATYWRFQNQVKGGCLTGNYYSHDVYLASCTSQGSQQWDWVHTNYLKNRASGLCLTTNWGKSLNDLRLAACDFAPSTSEANPQSWSTRYDSAAKGWLIEEGFGGRVMGYDGGNAYLADDNWYDNYRQDFYWNAATTTS